MSHSARPVAAAPHMPTLYSNFVLEFRTRNSIWNVTTTSETPCRGGNFYFLDAAMEEAKALAPADASAAVSCLSWYGSVRLWVSLLLGCSGWLRC